MREHQISALKEASNSTAKRLDIFLKFLSNIEDNSGGAFDISKQIRRTDSSVSDIVARTSLINGLIDKLEEKGVALAPRSAFSSFTGSAAALNGAIDQSEANITGYLANNGGLQSIDYDSYSMTFNNGTVIDVTGDFKTIFEAGESLITSFQTIFQAINPSRASFNFSAAASTLSQQISDQAREFQKIRSALNEAEPGLARINAAIAELDRITETSNALQANLESSNATAGTIIGQLETNKTEGEAAAEAARSLKADVDNYQKDFDEFEKRLEARNKEIASGSKKLEDLIKKFVDQEKSFDSTIEKSNQMLSSATVAGLASEFGTIRNDLDVKLTSAHRSFNWAIGFLFVSALPLILFVFAPFLVAILPNNANLSNAISGMTANQSGWHYVGQVFARFVILLPAVWYVTFCTARYNSLFKLKEHYSYKYSMAVAVEGFKKQAPDYQDMIAALVFEQLAFNPADKLGRRHDGPESPPSPIAKMLVTLLRRETQE